MDFEVVNSYYANKSDQIVEQEVASATTDLRLKKALHSNS